MDESRDHLDKIRSQFTRQADAYSRMRQTTDEASLTVLVALTGATARHRAVDVACGPGFLTMAFAHQCAKVVGVDATEELLSRARSEAEARGLDNVEFRLGDAERLPLPDAAFDIASCRAAFHHFLHPGRVLAEMKRVVKPGGRLLIADMLASADPAKAAYHNRIERLCDPTHVRALSEADFDELFEDAGLRIALRPQSPLDYELGEWIEHGGPGAKAVSEIVSLMEASLEVDRCGLNVRREGGAIRFTHTGVAFLLRVPA